MSHSHTLTHTQSHTQPRPSPGRSLQNSSQVPGWTAPRQHRTLPPCSPAPSESPRSAPTGIHHTQAPPPQAAQLPPRVPAIYNASGSQAWISLLRPWDGPVGTRRRAVSQAELGRTQPDCAWDSVCPDPRLGVCWGLMDSNQNWGSPCASPCAGVGSRLRPPRGDNPNSRDRLPRGCPSILAEGDFLQHPEKNPWWFPILWNGSRSVTLATCPSFGSGNERCGWYFK